jgi:hypothetical protein
MKSPNKKELVNLSEIEEEVAYQVDSSDLPPDDIIAYNELRSCADLFRLYEGGNLDIQPDFQREFVWNAAMQTRFIDSLTKQLPIPSMCLSLDFKTQKWQTIDGLQRLSTIIKFFEEENWVLSDLEDVRKEIASKKVSEIKLKSPVLYSKIQNVSLPINILRCDYARKDHAEYIFTIFHRLNAGGMRLNNQEIRNAVYSGPFNDSLKKLDDYLPWRKLLGVKEGSSDRFRRIELILRFFAFYDNQENYKGKLSSFLNDYMHRYRHAKSDFIGEKENLFKCIVDLVLSKISDEESLQKKLPKGRVSNALIESLMLGLAYNLPGILNTSKTQLKSDFNKLISNEDFSEDNLSEGIMKKEKVQGRFKVAKRIFKIS